MIHIKVLAVGGIKEKYYTDAIAEYAKRLTKYCKFEIIEVKECNQKDTASNIKQEAESIRGKIKGKVFLCDIKGEMTTSEMLADKIGTASQTASTITFIIGGSDGVDSNLDDIADAKISFGRNTFPHQLFRVMLTEQIYRAFTILNGEKYHK